MNYLDEPSAVYRLGFLPHASCLMPHTSLLTPHSFTFVSLRDLFRSFPSFVFSFFIVNLS